MAEICVIYASENEEIARQLVSLLGKYYKVWWAGEITQGNWGKVVRTEIAASKVVVPVFSNSTVSKNIFVDELKFAAKLGCLILPFLIENVDLPFGFGQLNRIEALGWKGEENNPGYKLLERKIATELTSKEHTRSKLKRALTLKLQNKTLKLPCFIFSLSSFETQLHPHDGIRLFNFLIPHAGLISAHDMGRFCNDNEFFNDINKLRSLDTTIFLDSGNYEADRKEDKFSKNNPSGWKRECFQRVASKLQPDIAFAFDDTKPIGDLDSIAEKIIEDFRNDEKNIQPRNFSLCPIVHLPKKMYGVDAVKHAPVLVARIASVLDPIMVAIPERELGDGLVERFKAVHDIRRELNKLGSYYPLHLLGAGNPITMMALATAGADSFDGLEWCRTIADYDKGFLFHFQHFDCFKKQNFSRLQSPKIRRIISNPDTPYTIKAISYNIDFFNDWTKTIQDMITAGNEENLLKNVPNIGEKLFEELAK